jgi:hypothetical protein
MSDPIDLLSCSKTSTVQGMLVPLTLVLPVVGCTLLAHQATDLAPAPGSHSIGERFPELVGDAILKLFLSEWIYYRYPEITAGDLTVSTRLHSRSS